MLLQLDDRFRDQADTANLSFAAAELLGQALDAVRVGYGVVNESERTTAVERNWSKPGFVSVEGIHKFDDYGRHMDDLLRGEVVTNVDVIEDPRTSAAASAFALLGIRAHLDVPVIEDGRTVADMFVHSDRPRFWNDAEIALVRDVAQRTRAAIARRLAEQELRGSEARLANALASARLGTFEWNPLTGAVHMDGPARAIFGFSPDAEITDNEVFARITKDQIAAIEKQARKAVGTGANLKLDFDIDLPDGGSRFVRSSAVPAVIGAGQRMVGVFQDETDLKMAERSLRTLNEQLEERVAERTAERDRVWRLSRACSE